VRRVDDTSARQTGRYEGEQREPAAAGDSLHVQDRPSAGRKTEVREGAKGESRRDPHGARAPPALVTRPPGASAELHATELDSLMVVACVKHDPKIASSKQLGDSTSMLEDPGIARRLEEMYLAHGGKHYAAIALPAAPCRLRTLAPLDDDVEHIGQLHLATSSRQTISVEMQTRVLSLDAPLVAGDRFRPTPHRLFGDIFLEEA
jgi:hypothetical protein